MKRTAQQLYDDIEKPKLIEGLKATRDAARFEPIVVNLSGADYTFDMDETAQKNIQGVLNSFEAVRQKTIQTIGWPDDGTIPWTLHDNSQIPVTLAGLQKVHDAAATRVTELHFQYLQAKAAL